jgi:hypothetical protein
MSIAADQFAKFAWAISREELNGLRDHNQVRRIFIPPTIADGLQIDLKWTPDGKQLELVVYRLKVESTQDHGRLPR